MRTDNQRQLLNLLTEEIYHQSWQCAAEQHNPQRGADEMDDYIAERSKNTIRLREIRNELEDIFTGFIARKSI